MLLIFQGHTDTVNHLRFSPDGRWIISAGEDGVAKVPYSFFIANIDFVSLMSTQYLRIPERILTKSLLDDSPSAF